MTSAKSAMESKKRETPRWEVLEVERRAIHRQSRIGAPSMAAALEDGLEMELRDGWWLLVLGHIAWRGDGPSRKASGVDFGVRAVFDETCRLGTKNQCSYATAMKVAEEQFGE